MAGPANCAPAAIHKTIAAVGAEKITREDGGALQKPEEPARIEAVADGDAPPILQRPTANKPLHGILLFALGVLFLACMDATTKYLATRYHVLLIVAVRYVINCLLLLAFVFPAMGPRMVQTQRTGLVLARAASLAAASLAMAFAFQRMPSPEATSIVFLAPALVLVLSGPLLREQIGWIGWLAVAAGFVGVLLIARPGTGLDGLGVAAALTAVGLTVLYQMLSRVLAASERAITLLFHTALVGAVVFGLAAPWFWFAKLPRLIDAALFLSLGVYAAIGHYLFTAAHRFAAASTLAPIGYLQVVYAGVLGWIVFGHIPAGQSLMGMAVIIASGVLITLNQSLKIKST